MEQKIDQYNSLIKNIPIETFSWFQRAGEEIHKKGIFVGCPLQLFELTSRDLFCVALMEGMEVNDKVLEIGCGCLRTGYWFIQYLNQNNYFGIEPNKTMLKTGVEVLLGNSATIKNPIFDDNDKFILDMFNQKFDYVVAFSIWSHASKKQISQMLDQFLIVGKDTSKLISSWATPTEFAPDYIGDDWVGRSHRSDKAGFVTHSKKWLINQANSRGLKINFMTMFTSISQEWLVIEKQ